MTLPHLTIERVALAVVLLVGVIALMVAAKARSDLADAIAGKAIANAKKDIQQ